MLSHKFRTHTWAKRKQSAKDHANFLMNSTNAQRSFIHELASQQLGNAPSNMWGVPIPEELHTKADPETLHFIMHSAKQAPHEFGRLISTHKKASGIIGDIGEAIGSGVKTVANYGGKVAKWWGKYGDGIKSGVSVGKDLLQTGTTIAQLSGLMGGKTKDTLDGIAAALDKQVQTFGGKKPEKKGGNFGRILI